MTLNCSSNLRELHQSKALLRCPVLGMVAFLLAIPLQISRAADPVDWSHWRGPELNGISREKNLPETWSPEGENLLWSKPEYASRCTPISMNGKIYLVCRAFPETTQEGEKTVCLNADTGELVWESVHNIFLTDAPAERVGWSSPVGDPSTGNVYVLGLGCQFQCLNGETGEIVWEHAMSEEYGMLSTYGGRTNFPSIFDDLVIISGVMTQWGDNAVPAHRFVAFDKRTGAAVWFIGTKPRPEDTTFSTPVFTVFNGQAAMVFGAGDGCVYAVQPRTGKIIWRYDASDRGINTPPLVVDNVVYCGHGEQNRSDMTVLGAAFAFDGRATGDIPEKDLLWKIPKKTIGRSAPLMVDNRLYMLEDGATMLIIDPKTGKLITEKKLGRIMHGSLIYGDGKIYCAEFNGNFWILKPSEKGVEELARIRLSEGDSIAEELIASPIISRGKIYLPTSKALYCIGLKDAKPDAEPISPKLQESPVSEDQEIAHIQIAPVEAMLAPGQQTPYQVRAYNKKGQYLKLVDAIFTVDGGGAIDGQGNFTAAADASHAAVSITAKVGELSSTARVRVIPPLPWKFDFNDKKVPVTWIGAAYRHQPTDFQNESVLVKISTIPKGTRSQSWMGWTTLHDYTVQADFYATTENNQRPDLGLINQRYTLDLMGKGELQLRSWTPRLALRFAKTLPFEWQPEQWYTMKFQSENTDGAVTLRGKVWKRGEAEPAQWSIEASDATPNRNGSPGTFGNATFAQYYIDNVEVYPNK